MICRDLKFVLYKPFKNPKLRLIKEITGTFFATFLFSYIAMANRANGSLYAIAWIELIIFCSFLAYAIHSIFYAARQMKHNLFGPGIKRLILKRHVAYIAIFSTLNMFMLIGNIMYITNEKDQFRDHATAWIKVLQVMFYSRGFLLPMVRLIEPNFIKIIFRNIKQICTCCNRN